MLQPIQFGLFHHNATRVLEKFSMLVSAHIEKFRTCNDVRISDFGPVMVLVGRNGVGKTNIMRAIVWASEAATASPSSGEDSAGTSGAVSLQICLKSNKFEYSISIELEAATEILNEDGKYPQFPLFLKESLSVETNGVKRGIFSRNRNELWLNGNALKIELGPMSPALSSIASLVPNHTDIDLLIQLTNFLKGIRYYPLDATETVDKMWVIGEREYKSWLGGKVAKASIDRLLMFKLLHMKFEEPDVFDELNGLVGPNGLAIVRNIDVQSFDVPFKTDAAGAATSTHKYFFVRFAPSNHQENRDFNFDDLSFGTRRILRLMISLLFDKSNVSLVEQPEDGIHPGLLHKLIPLLRDNATSGQFIFSSHSPDVLNRVSPEEVRLVELYEGVSTVRSLTGKEVEAACLYMEQDGPFSDFVSSIQDL